MGGKIRTPQQSSAPEEWAQVGVEIRKYEGININFEWNNKRLFLFPGRNAWEISAW